MARACRQSRRFGRRAGAIAGVLAVCAASAAGVAGADTDGPAVAAQPPVSAGVSGLAFDAAGRLHAADRHDDRVLTLGFGDELLGVLGAGHLDAPAAVAVAPGGDVLVADRGGVRRFGPDGTPAGAFAADDPAGIAVAGDGTVYVSEPGRVARFAPDGARLGAWAADDPRGLAVAADGAVWAAVAGALAHFDAAGAALGVTPADDPVGVAAAPDGTLLVAERGGDRVARVSADGARIGELAGFDQPRGVAVDCRGTVAVSDRSPARIHRLLAAGGPPPCDVAAALRPAPAPVPALAGVLVEPARPVARRPPGISQGTAPQPALGVSALVSGVSGTVLARRPGERGVTVPAAGDRLAMGTRIDARGGRVRLAFAADAADFDRLGTTQTADVDSGVFSIHQAPGRSAVELRLRGALPGCGLPAYARPVGPRHVWAGVRGRFAVSGRQATVTASTGAARWLTEDRCDGTLVRVTGGAADVRDRVRRRTVGVRAGGRYLARPARRRASAAARGPRRLAAQAAARSAA
ncbi:MAG: tripartite motif-containing protein 71 [Solirubrobacteraceae bacterium]|nr:tripartite motif-containing protein 71 [Solirubrobacteraceae bacterium]